MYISSTLSEDESNSGKYSWHFSFHILSAFMQVKFTFQSKFEVSWKATSLARVNSIQNSAEYSPALFFYCYLFSPGKQ